MKKRILIELDYSYSSEKVAIAGYELATQLVAEIVMVHVVAEHRQYKELKRPIMGYHYGCNENVVTIARDIKKEAENFLEAAVEYIGDSNIKTMVLEGNTADAILAYSRTCKADLIVMGSHRHYGLHKLLVTYVAAHVLTHSKIPLFIIPTGE